MNILVIRPRGVVSSGQSQGVGIVETSIEALHSPLEQSWAFHDRNYGVVVLEDLLFSDLDDDIRGLIVGSTSGVSCPIATRWSKLPLHCS